MILGEHKEWFLQIDDIHFTLHSLTEVKNKIAECKNRDKGAIQFSADDGKRPFLHRILGLKRYIRAYFAIEWNDNVAMLIFYDENWSEFRLKASEKMLVENDNFELFGEVATIMEKYLLNKDYAFEIIRSFLNEGLLPSYLEFEFFK
tara:strand:- start:40 stop:480 length:441 start_codon:yes stop_codon:yes gene_type:complete